MSLMVSLKKSWKKYLILIIAGIAATFVFRTNFNRKLFDLVFFADLFFNISMAFLAWGLFRLVGSMDMFASLIYGTKCLFKLMRGKQDSGESMKEGYLEYLRTRPRHSDPALLVFAGVFFVISISLAFISG